MRAFLLIIVALFLSSCGVNNVTSSSSTTTTSTSTSTTLNYLSGDYNGCAVGAFVNGMENINSFEATIGKDLAVVLWYVHWEDPFPTAEANSVEANGSVPLITWEPWLTAPTGTLEAISSGSYESYVRGFMQAAKDWGKPLFLRFAHEMNGNWYPWDGFNSGQATGPERYKRAWRYIYSIREELGADNVYLVWSPNNTSLPAESWNTPEAYYPGDQYVDWIGMDGYNWGYESWQTFSTVFDDIYNQLTVLTDKPLMIGEFSSADLGGSKADWITDAMSRIKNDYPRIKLFCWFNINKERDWRVDPAMRDALQDSHFLATMK